MTLRTDTAALRSHATELDRIAGSGVEAVRAAQEARLGSDALGGLCGPIVNAVLGPLESAGCLNARLAVGLVTGSADGLRDIADLLDSTDAGATETMAALWGLL